MDDYKKQDLDYLRPLDGLKHYAGKELKSYASGAYLHGSLATKDYIKGWSDVDTATIISKNTINDAESLLKVRDAIYRMRYFFYKIDPLQHHGTIAISEYDIDYYPETYFPVEIFKYARSLLGNDARIKFRVRDSSYSAIKRLFWFVSYLRKLKLTKNYSMNSYDMKTLLHSVAIFPAVYLQAKGVFVYKKFSFGIAKRDFKNGLWKPVDAVSSLRLSWKKYHTVPLIGLFKANPLFYHQLNFRIVDAMKKIDKTNNINTKEIIDGMYDLSEEAWSRVTKNAE